MKKRLFRGLPVLLILCLLLTAAVLAVGSGEEVFRVRSFGRDPSGALCFTGSMADGSRLYKAEYGADGRMLSSTVTTDTDWTLPLLNEDTAVSVRFFVTDRQGRPLTEAVTYDKAWRADSTEYWTLGEALDEAAQYVRQVEDVTEDNHATVRLSGSSTLWDLSLPQGYRILIEESGDLTLNGSLDLAHSSMEWWTSDAGSVLLDGAGKLTVNGVQLTGEGGAFRLSEGSTLELSGPPLEAANDSRPFLFLQNWGGGELTLEKDLTLDGSLCQTFILNWDSTLLLQADLNLCPYTGFYPEFRGMTFLCSDPEAGLGSISLHGERRFGYTDDCGMQLIPGNGLDYGIRTEGTRVIFWGGDVNVNRSGSYDEVQLWPSDDIDGLTLTVKAGTEVELSRLALDADLTVEARAVLTLPDDAELPQGRTLLNCGILYMNGFERVYGTLENCGTAVVNGSLELSGAAFTNHENASLEIFGGVMMGTDCNTYARSGVEEDYRPVHSRSMNYFRNEGSIIVYGALTVDCNSAVNSGTMVNFGFLLLDNYLTADMYQTWESITCPESETNQEGFWDSFAGWDVNAEPLDEGMIRYWRIADTYAENIRTLDGSFTNTGTVDNYGYCLLNDLIFRNEGSFYTESNVELQNTDPMVNVQWLKESQSAANISYAPVQFLNSGSFMVGSEYAFGSFRQTGGSFANLGSVTNFGSMNLEDVDYTQDSGAFFRNEASGSLEILGGSMTVPTGSEYRSEGYMRIIDRFGSEYADGSSVCDLSGFADFETEWNLDNEYWLNRCYFTAEVYDANGYEAAVTAQRNRSWSRRYERMDFMRDITCTHDVTLDDFDLYYIRSGIASETDGYYDLQSVTLTVPQGVTLTVGNDARLCVDYCLVDYLPLPAALTVRGTLRTMPELEELWEDDELIREYRRPGTVEITVLGRFDAEGGTIINEGRFEVYYEESYDWSDEGYVFTGEIIRPEGCDVIGAPENAYNNVYVSSAAGLDAALASNAPRFSALLSESGEITLTHDVTIPDTVRELNILWQGRLIIPAGITLEMNCTDTFNSGFVGVYGDLEINGAFWNYNEIEVGTPDPGDTASITVNGELYNSNRITLYHAGSVKLGSGSMTNDHWGEDGIEYLEVEPTEALQPGAYSGLRFTSDVLIPNQHDSGGYGYNFANCVFEGSVTLHYQNGYENLFVNFFDSCFFDDCVYVEESGVNSYDMMNDCIFIAGASRANVVSKCPVMVESHVNGCCSLNGVTAEIPEGNDGWFTLCQFFGADPWGVGTMPVFQVESGEGTVLKLTGYLWDEMHIYPYGSVDISELELGEGIPVYIHDEYGSTRVYYGSDRGAAENG